MGRKRYWLRSHFATTSQTRANADVKRIERLDNVPIWTPDAIDQHILQTQRPIVLVFSADWCAPCRYFLGKPEPKHHNGGPDLIRNRPASYGRRNQPGYEFLQMLTDNENRADFIIADIQKYPELKNRFGITAVPQIVILHKDQIFYETRSGFQTRGKWVSKTLNSILLPVRRPTPADIVFDRI